MAWLCAFFSVCTEPEGSSPSVIGVAGRYNQHRRTQHRRGLRSGKQNPNTKHFPLLATLHTVKASLKRVQLQYMIYGTKYTLHFPWCFTFSQRVLTWFSDNCLHSINWSTHWSSSLAAALSSTIFKCEILSSLLYWLSVFATAMFLKTPETV